MFGFGFLSVINHLNLKDEGGNGEVSPFSPSPIVLKLSQHRRKRFDGIWNCGKQPGFGGT
jgi:hypothetical protein